jgi:DNA-binding Xre family transcriptional regulator
MSDQMIARIKFEAAKRGLKMRQIAEAMGIHENSLSRMMRADLRISSLRRIADAIGCDVKEIL